MGKWCFGIDLGGTTVKCALFQDNGTVVDKWEIVTRTENNGDAILPDIADTVLKKIAEKGIDKAEVVGLGIGVPGPVEESGEIPCAVNLHWGRKNIEKELGDMTGLSVKAGNDANVAALGEMWKGGGQGYRSLVAVTLGTGIGGGVIVDGKLLTGCTGAGGEIGHIHIMDDEPDACGCGKHGCLEQYGSATGIVRLANRTLASTTQDTILRSSEISAKSVFDAVKAGDAVAIQIAQQFGEILGKGLAIIASILNPELFVIGGGVSKAGEVLFEYIRPAYEKYVFHGSRKTEFALATLGNDAGIYGAAKLVLDK